jgi:hypothetical protein
LPRLRFPVIRRSSHWLEFATAMVALVLLSPALEAQGSAEVSTGVYASQFTGIPTQVDFGGSFKFSQLYPGIGLISGATSTASTDRVRRGESSLQLSNSQSRLGLIDASIGDTQIDLNSSVRGENNTNSIPFLSLTGARFSLARAGRRIEIFRGTEYIISGPQITQRLSTGRDVSGLVSSWSLGRRFKIGTRLLSISNNKPNQDWFLSNVSASITRSLSIANQFSWQVRPSLDVFGEVAGSWSQFRQFSSGKRGWNISHSSGVHWQISRLRIVATYLSQAIDYMPLANSQLGARSGLVTEVRYRLLPSWELFGSSSQLQGTISLLPQVSYASEVFSGGLNGTVGQTSIAGNITSLSAKSSLTESNNIQGNQLATLNVSRPLGRQNLRIGLEDLKIQTALGSTTQRVAEVEDSVRLRRLSLGGAMRFERQNAETARNELAARAFWNYSWHFLSGYGSFEAGSDLANSSLLTRTASQTTTVGVSAALPRQWQLRADAYRSNLLISLNPGNLALLAENGVGPAMVLNANQWTTFLRLSRSFAWSGATSLAHVTDLARKASAETGEISGSISAGHSLGREEGLAGIPVHLDRSRFALTDHQGIFRFANVPEGQHVVGVDVWHLPADYDPPETPELAVVVQAHHAPTVHFSLHHLGSLRGQVKGMPAHSGLVVEMDDGARITSPDDDGSFSLDNIKEGKHTLRLRQSTIPENYIQTEGPGSSIEVACGNGATAQFGLTYAPKAKPVRTIECGAQGCSSAPHTTELNPASK